MSRWQQNYNLPVTRGTNHRTLGLAFHSPITSIYLMQGQPDRRAWRFLTEGTWKETHGLPVCPETQLVPVQPLDPPGSNPRRFAACYLAGRAVGPCAALVNPSSTATVAVPRGLGKHLMVLHGGSVFEGGLVTLDGAVPARLGPAEAVILLP